MTLGEIVAMTASHLATYNGISYLCTQYGVSKAFKNYYPEESKEQLLQRTVDHLHSLKKMTKKNPVLAVVSRIPIECSLYYYAKQLDKQKGETQ